jgi:hypothetical protein
MLFVSFPVVSYSSAIVEPARFGMARSAWTSHETMTGFMISYLSQSELAGRSLLRLWDGLPKRPRTWLICRDKSITRREPEG